MRADEDRERRLDAFEIGMLRSVADVRWDIFIRDEEFRKRLRQTQVSLKLRRAKLKWFGQVKRIGEDRQVERITNAEMQGRRLVGRPYRS